MQALSCNDWDENPPTIEVDMWDESRMEVSQNLLVFKNVYAKRCFPTLTCLVQSICDYILISFTSFSALTTFLSGKSWKGWLCLESAVTPSVRCGRTPTIRLVQGQVRIMLCHI